MFQCRDHWGPQMPNFKRKVRSCHNFMSFLAEMRELQGEEVVMDAICNNIMRLLNCLLTEPAMPIISEGVTS